jgi:hypothetical protein
MVTLEWFCFRESVRWAVAGLAASLWLGRWTVAFCLDLASMVGKGDIQGRRGVAGTGPYDVG